MASALLAELGELARGLGLHLLDAHFEPPRRHGEFGAQLILVGLDFRHRQRRRRLEAPHGQPHGAVMHERDDEQADEQAANRNPIPKYMTGSIIGYASKPNVISSRSMPWSAPGAASFPSRLT